MPPLLTVLRFTETYNIRKSVLFDVWYAERDKTKQRTALMSYVLNVIPEKNLHEDYVNNLEEKLRLFCVNLTQKWKGCDFSRSKFLNKHAHWLSSDMTIDKYTARATKSSVGRPHLSFEKKSARSQRKDASDLAKKEDAALLVQAASMAAKSSNSKGLAIILKEAARSPTRPFKMRKLLSEGKEKQSPIPLTPEEALAFILDNNLSKEQYKNIRKMNKSHNCDIYPAYEHILNAKSACRMEGLEVTDIVAKIPLRNLLEHTTQRIIFLQEDVFIQFMDSQNVDTCCATMIFSYGFDGSSGQANYKQKFECEVSNKKTFESSLFATTVILLRFTSTSGTILWNNRTPQSNRFCRPLKLEYTNETKEHILIEKAALDEEIKNLQEYNHILSNGKSVKVTFVLLMTLIGGKVLNILTNTKSSQACPICGAKPTQFQSEQFDSKTFQSREHTLQYGISPLHSWIRLFECILHIGYRIDIQIWQIRGDKNKEKFQKRKQQIQQKFWERLSLHVDKPRANGHGSSNDGNTSRRAFNNPELFSQFTGVDLELIKSFRIILIALASQYPINSEKFGSFCLKVGQLYKQLYPWYPMPASVHKILVHGQEIIAHAILPVGK